MGTVISYSHRVSKPKWVPPNDEVAARVRHLVEIEQQRSDLEGESLKLMAVLVDEDHMPIKTLAEVLKTQRKTVYRRLGRMP